MEYGDVWRPGVSSTAEHKNLAVVGEYLHVPQKVHILPERKSARQEQG